MTLQQVLDKYCVARCVQDKQSQLEIANQLVDYEIPLLVERMAEVIIERNRLAADVRSESLHT
jgi:hypothetical protein